MSNPLYDRVLARLNQYIGPIDDGSAKARRRAHVLRAATELFATQGYRKTSMDEVARKAGVAKGTLYTYYPTKVDLAIAAISLEKREHLHEMAGWLDPTRPAKERLRALLLGMVQLPARMPLTAMLLRRDGDMAALMAELPEELAQQNIEDRNEFLGELIGEVAQPHSWTQSELNDRAAVVAGMAFASVHAQDEHTRGGLPLGRYAEILVDTLIAGLRGGRKKGQSS